jgi:hypothetical protein
MRLLISILALSLCISLNAQKDKKATSKWFDGTGGAPSPTTEDYITAKKGVLLYSVFNDDQNIYFLAKITESIDQNKVLQMGLTLWINNDGKSRKENGIRFPIGAKVGRGRAVSQYGQVNSESPLAAANTIQLTGFKDIAEKRFPSDNKDKCRGTIKYDNDGNLIYLMIIPVSMIPEVAKKTPGKPVAYNFGIEYGAMPEMNMQRPAGGGGGEVTMPAGGRGGRGGGGAGARPAGGGGGTGGPGMSQNQDAVLVWVKDITLATGK